MKRSASSAERVLTRQVTTSFGVGIEGYPEGYPGPSVTDPVLAPALLWDVLRLRSDEVPNFVALQTTHAEVADVAVMITGARLSQINEQARDGVPRYACHPGRGANTIAFNQGRNYLGLAANIYAIHIDHYA